MNSRALLVAVTLSILIVVSPPAFAQQDVFEQATVAYENGEYASAIRSFEAMRASGVQDAAVYYNLGAAYYQEGDLARALVNFRRAQRFVPRDHDLNTNIALIRAQRLDIQGDETGLLESLNALTSNVLTVTELAWIGLALWTMWFVLLSTAILRGRLREMLRGPLLIVGVVALVGLLLIGSRLYVAASIPSAVVVVSSVPVVTGPGEEFLEIFQLHEAAELHHLELRGEWLRFSLPDGRQGWIPADSVEMI